MTASAELDARDSEPAGPRAERWREQAQRDQRAALPSGEVTLSCSAPLGMGGLGRHVGELADALTASAGPAPNCITGDGPAGGRPLQGALSALPLPVSPGLRTWAHMVEFDRRAAHRLPPGQHLIAFNGQALRQFAAAERAGYGSRWLVSANSHIEQVRERHAQAHRRHPLEGSWAARMRPRTLAEYERAERILYASDYIRDSFLARGIAQERLVRFPLTPAPRYAPATGQAPVARERSPSDSFEIVYVGSLAVHKGVPLLIEALGRLAHLDLKLTLVGGWGTRGMRRFVQRACAEDPRITVAPGDPLAHLRRAALCVHPAYEDGFGYAPAEALACGVPLIISEDTGMKELIDSPDRGLVLATGELEQLSEAIEAACRGEILAA